MGLCTLHTLSLAGGNVGIGTLDPGDFRLKVEGTLSVTGASTFTNNVGITDKHRLEFGANISGKERSAGMIGYQTFTDSDGLDIVGAGTANNNRKLKFWAEGGSTFTGPVIFDPGRLYNKAGEGPLVTELLKPKYRVGCFILLPGDGVNSTEGGNWDLISLVKRTPTEVFRFRLNRNNEYKATPG